LDIFLRDICVCILLDFGTCVFETMFSSMTVVSNEFLPLEQVLFGGLRCCWCLRIICFDHELLQNSNYARSEQSVSLPTLETGNQIWVKGLSFYYIAWSAFNNFYMQSAFLENYYEMLWNFHKTDKISNNVAYLWFSTFPELS